MEDEIEVKHSVTNTLSYGSGSLAREFLSMAFSTTVFFYYEVTVNLDVWYVVIGFIIFAIYNMFNDPIIGYLTNRPFKFTKKWGRRFPWLIFGGIPFGISYFLIFTPPDINIVGQVWVFAWLIFTTCLFDTFHSLYFVNFISLFAEKYRTNKERRRASGIYVPIGVIGVAFGAIIPRLIFTYGDLASYTFQGLIIFIISIVFMFLAIPGFKENPKYVEDYLKTYEQAPRSESFFKSFRNALKHGSFVVWMFYYFTYFSLINTMQNSLDPTVLYVLNRPAGASTLIFAAFMLGAIASTPLWTKLAHKVNNNKKVILFAGILLGALAAPLLFLEDYWGIIITMLFWGVGLGGFWFMIFPVMSDVIDESVARTGKREEGVYAGFSQFFARLGIVSQALTFGIVHTLTGFDVDPTSSLARWGIHIHLSLIPMIFIFVGVLVFWRFYKLTPEKIKANKEKLKEMGLE
ncbi:MAG: MFS transporter [Promethearchaeota archaeon]|nr:MAG: MFS transporter [Candidatus Lokiarchaeota archaeon]